MTEPEQESIELDVVYVTDDEEWGNSVVDDDDDYE